MSLGARFEFRVWGEVGHGVGDRLRSLSDPLDSRDSVETYLTSQATVDANPKVRDDLLDIKMLLEERDGFQRWDVHLKAEFPLSNEVVMDLCDVLRVEAPPLTRDEYTLAELLEVVDAHAELAALEVTKHRELRSLGEVTGEVSRVVIANRPMETVAIESTDLVALVEVRRALELEGRDNLSYPQAMRAIGTGTVS